MWFKKSSEQTSPKAFRRQITEHIQEKLWLTILVALFLGAVFGYILSPDVAIMKNASAAQLSAWIAFPGYLFLRVLQMVVIPLVMASLILGIAGGDSAGLVKKLSWRVIVYFMFTTTVAVSIGLLFGHMFEPGQMMNVEQASGMMQGYTPPPVNEALTDSSNIPKRIVGLIPKNPFASIASGDMLSIVIFSIFVGFALTAMSTLRSKPVLDLAHSVQDLCMVLVSWMIRLAPYAVFGLIVDAMVKLGVSSIVAMGLYVVTVLSGLLVMLIFYALIVTVLGMNPVQYFKNIREAQLIAFSTSSSAATMPVTMRVADEKLKVNPAVSGFTVPLGTTINMDGTALYQTIATMFLAQVFQIDLSAWDMMMVLTLAIAASVGTPGTPGVGIIVLATILISVGIPPEGIALILGVDRILDMCRTTINVTGDLTATIVMNRLLGKESLKDEESIYMCLHFAHKRECAGAAST